MLFVHELTVPANTLASAPVRETMSLSPGRVSEVSVFFPFKRGPFVGVRFIHFEHQLWPVTPDRWIIGDDETVDWDEDFDLEEEPYELHVEAYNTDDTFAHTVYVRIAMVDIEKAATTGPWGLLTRVARMLGVR